MAGRAQRRRGVRPQTAGHGQRAETEAGAHLAGGAQREHLHRLQPQPDRPVDHPVDPRRVVRGARHRVHAGADDRDPAAAAEHRRPAHGAVPQRDPRAVRGDPRRPPAHTARQRHRPGRHPGRRAGRPGHRRRPAARSGTRGGRRVRAHPRPRMAADAAGRHAARGIVRGVRARRLPSRLRWTRPPDQLAGAGDGGAGVPADPARTADRAHPAGAARGGHRVRGAVAGELPAPRPWRVRRRAHPGGAGDLQPDSHRHVPDDRRHLRRGHGRARAARRAGAQRPLDRDPRRDDGPVLHRAGHAGGHLARPQRVRGRGRRADLTRTGAAGSRRLRALDHDPDGRRTPALGRLRGRAARRPRGDREPIDARLDGHHLRRTGRRGHLRDRPARRPGASVDPAAAPRRTHPGPAGVRARASRRGHAAAGRRGRAGPARRAGAARRHHVRRGRGRRRDGGRPDLPAGRRRGEGVRRGQRRADPRPAACGRHDRGRDRAHPRPRRPVPRRT